MHQPPDWLRMGPATKWIIIISGVLLPLQTIVGKFAGPVLVEYFGLIPAYVTGRYWLWQPLTYLFLHGGVFHWLFNMLIFWMFGAELERQWGTRQFLKYFFITGVGSALCVLALTPHSVVPTIGSSGAVFGFIVAFAMMFPNAVMYLYFLIPLKVWQAAILFAFIEFFTGMQGGGSGISQFAHLGGMATGYVYLRWWSTAWIRLKGSLRSWRKPKNSVEFHEVTDELVERVDHILDKVLKHGADSLTPEEKKIMDRYSQRKH